MMSYRVYLTRRALKDLERLPEDVRKRIGAAIDLLSAKGRAAGARKLATKGWRVRVGDYRVLFHIDDAERLITIFRIRHRKEANRR